LYATVPGNDISSDNNWELFEEAGNAFLIGDGIARTTRCTSKLDDRYSFKIKF
jgi:hypothetical protein